MLRKRERRKKREKREKRKNRKKRLNKSRMTKLMKHCLNMRKQLLKNKCDGRCKVEELV